MTSTPNLDVGKISQLISEGIWSEIDYEPLGIRIAEPFVVPEGKQIKGNETFVEDGETIRQVFEIEDIPPPLVPSEVSPYQARVVLHHAGLLSAVEALMADPETPVEARIAWEYAITIQRHSPFISALGPALGLTEEQIDGLFLAAVQIE